MDINIQYQGICESFCIKYIYEMEKVDQITLIRDLMYFLSFSF